MYSVGSIANVSDIFTVSIFKANYFEDGERKFLRNFDVTAYYLHNAVAMKRDP
jgi:hypothetical protein